MIRTAWIPIVTVLLLLAMQVYAQVSINYVGISIVTEGQRYTQVVNVTGNRLLIPAYQYCSGGGSVSFTAYLDPLSSLGITSAYLVLYNGTFVAIPMNYSPKYVSTVINCSLPIYGVYLSIGHYMPYPLEALVMPGPNMTYPLTQGSLNITIPTMPGFEYLLSIVRVISISPATATINNYLTEPASTEYSSISVGSVSTYAKITTYITYSSEIEITANGTTYVVVTPYYYAPMSGIGNYLVPMTTQPMIMLTGAPWIDYSITNCSIANPGIPKLTPWTEYLKYSPSCVVNITVKPVTLSLTSLASQELSCSNIFLATQGRAPIEVQGNVTINPTTDRVIYLIINGVKTIPIYLNSVPTTSITIKLPLITRQDISVLDKLGKPISPALYINMNGTLLLFTNSTCVLPGNYGMYALINGELVNLGSEYVGPGNSLTIPIFSNYMVNVYLTQECPDLGLELVVKYGGQEFVTPLYGGHGEVSIPNALLGNYVQIYLLGNGSLLYQYQLLINSTDANITLTPHIINFMPTDLLGNELTNAVLNIGNLHYVGSGRYCVPVNSSLGIVIYDNEVYVVNVTGSNVYVRIWTLGPLGIKSLLTMLGLLILLMTIIAMLRRLGGGGRGGSEGDEYVIIR